MQTLRETNREPVADEREAGSEEYEAQSGEDERVERHITKDELIDCQQHRTEHESEKRDRQILANENRPPVNGCENQGAHSAAFVSEEIAGERRENQEDVQHAARHEQSFGIDRETVDGRYRFRRQTASDTDAAAACQSQSDQNQRHQRHHPQLRVAHRIAQLLLDDG